MKVASVSVSFNQQKVLNYQKFNFEVENLKNISLSLQNGQDARVLWICQVQCPSLNRTCCPSSQSLCLLIVWVIHYLSVVMLLSILMSYKWHTACFFLSWWFTFFNYVIKLKFLLCVSISFVFFSPICFGGQSWQHMYEYVHGRVLSILFPLLHINVILLYILSWNQHGGSRVGCWPVKGSYSKCCSLSSNWVQGEFILARTNYSGFGFHHLI